MTNCVDSHTGEGALVHKLKRGKSQARCRLVQLFLVPEEKTFIDIFQLAAPTSSKQNVTP